MGVEREIKSSKEKRKNEKVILLSVLSGKCDHGRNGCRGKEGVRPPAFHWDPDYIDTLRIKHETVQTSRVVRVLHKRCSSFPSVETCIYICLLSLPLLAAVDLQSYSLSFIHDRKQILKSEDRPCSSQTLSTKINARY